MNNKMIKLLTVVGGLLLMSPLAFAGSEPAPPPAELTDGRPVIKRVHLSIVPSPSVCNDGMGGLVVDGCIHGDLTIVGRCRGIIISEALEDYPLEEFGLVVTGANPEDITDIFEEGLEGRTLLEIGRASCRERV